MRWFLTTFALTIALDQITKSFSWYFNQEAIINPGISFALLGGESQVYIILLNLVGMVLLSLIYGYYWAKNPAVAGLFFGGGLSNLIDRLWLGGVRDWIPLPILSLRNNLADYAVVISVMIIIWHLRKEDENEIA